MITHLLAVDGGGTKTALRLTPLEPLKTAPFFTLTFGPSSLTQQGPAAIETIRSAIAQCLREHQLRPAHVSIVVGVAGAGNIELKQQLQLALSRYPICQVTTDAHISLLGANDGMPVNTIAIGTGSVATKFSTTGEISIYGGWGFPIGDEGGGAWLGQQAVRSLISAIETGHHSAITKQLSKTIGHTRPMVLQWLKTANASTFAQFAPDVLNAAQQGCEYSKNILLQANQHIDKLITKCCKNNELDIAFLGSLGAYYQSHIQPQWRSRVIQTKGSALDGATLLARQQMDVTNE